MIQCLIVDDEQPAINIIAAYVEKVPYLNLVATTTDPLEGLKLINEHEIDLIFLDIQMPGLTGLEFVKAINGKCKVIFTTAYNQYAPGWFRSGRDRLPAETCTLFPLPESHPESPGPDRSTNQHTGRALRRFYHHTRR